VTVLLTEFGTLLTAYLRAVRERASAESYRVSGLRARRFGNRLLPESLRIALEGNWGGLR